MRHIRFEDGAAGFLIAKLDGLDDTATAADLFADALINEHVRVHGRADGQHETGDTRQGQRGIENAHDAENDQHVDGHGDVGIGAPAPIAQEHEQRDADHGNHRRCDTGADRVSTQIRTDRALFNHGELHRQFARAQRDRELVCALDREIAANLRRTAKDRLIDVWR